MPRQKTISKDQSLEAEEFDFENISSSDDDDDDPPIPATPEAAIAGPVAQVVNNLVESTKKSSNAAQDVWHFFVKADGFSVCQVCKYVTRS